MSLSCFGKTGITLRSPTQTLTVTLSSPAYCFKSSRPFLTGLPAGTSSQPRREEAGGRFQLVSMSKDIHCHFLFTGLNLLLLPDRRGRPEVRNKKVKGCAASEGVNDEFSSSEVVVNVNGLVCFVRVKIYSSCFVK